MANEPYNPLHKRHLGESVAKALLARPVIHPGRPWAAKLQPNSRSHKDILDDVAEFLG